MAIYELKTFSDIVNAVIEELKIQDSDNVTISRIKRNINIIYMDEVCANTRWKWLRRRVDLTHYPYELYECSVTKGSRAVTLASAPTDSKKGYLFSVDEQVYEIAQHEAGSTSLELESAYTKATAAEANCKVWTDKIVMPGDCRETFEVTVDNWYQPLENDGYQNFLRRRIRHQKWEGKPRMYTTTDWVDPDEYEAVSGAPTVTNRSSSGLIKTLTLNADPTNYFQVNNRIEISGASNRLYNGRFVISSINSSTNTITYTGSVGFDEVSTADTGITVQVQGNPGSSERVRQMLVHPSLSQDYVTVHLDYIRYATSLENDADEPLIPLEDRVVLLYGSLSRDWVRERNETTANMNFQKYQKKLAEMKGKLDDSTDTVKLQASKTYLRDKRRKVRYRYDWVRFD
jgi:hypothetical protein